MLKDAFFNVYTKFKLHFYQEIFSRFQDREASLTTVETFCMEAIQALGSPTVNEFATFMRISPPNAAYKVNSLIKKGTSARSSLPTTGGNTIWRSRRSISTTTTSARLHDRRHEPHHAAVYPGGVRQAGGDAHHHQPGADGRSGDSRRFRDKATKEAAQAVSLCRFLFKTVPPECGYPLWGPSPRQSPPAGSPRFWVLPRD